MKKVDVEFTTFDSWIAMDANIGSNIELIKIDTEGAEWHVLAGMRGFLEHAAPKPTLLIEVASGQSHPEWSKALAQFEWLFAHGYARNGVEELTETTDMIFEPI